MQGLTVRFIPGIVLKEAGQRALNLSLGTDAVLL